MVDNRMELARFNMIEQQVRPWEVLDQRVLELMLRTPREEYVPDGYRELAFADTELPLGHGQRMMPPRVEARMLQALDVQSTDTVLEIGTGSGFVTALLAGLARHVYSVEIHPDLSEQAARRLARHGIVNVTLDVGDGVDGWSRSERYDVIAVTGSMPVYNARLQTQLAVGGRLFVIVGEAPAMEAQLVTRISEDEFRRESLFETVVPALENAPQPERFVF